MYTIETQIVLDNQKHVFKNVVLPNFIHGSKQLHYTVYDIPMGERMHFHSHWHSEYEIFIVMNNHLDFIVDGIQYHILPGEALFLHADTVHGHADFYADYGRYICFSFGESFLFPDRGSFIYNQWFLPLKEGQLTFTQHIKGNNPHEQEIIKILHELVGLSQQIPENALSIHIELLRIFDIMVRENAFHTSVKSSVRNEAIKSALQYITSNFPDPIYVSEIAKYLNLSVDHFSRLFKSVVGTTPKEYILDLRIQNAIEIINTNPYCVVSEVARMSGFTDANYFSRIFKSKIGVSPSEHQRNLKQAD